METVSQLASANHVSRITRTTAWGNGRSGMTTYSKAREYVLWSVDCCQLVVPMFVNASSGKKFLVYVGPKYAVTPSLN